LVKELGSKKSTIGLSAYYMSIYYECESRVEKDLKYTCQRFSNNDKQDLTVFKEVWSTNEDRFFLVIKSIKTKSFFSDFEKEKNYLMMTPVKAVKGECQEIRNRDKVSNDLYSIAVSRIRQPLESLFNWLIEKTNIQRACKVRSTKGLLVHLFGKIAATFINLVF
jgi:hypothetical protein